MSFDDDVDAAKKRLEAARAETETGGFDDLNALQKILPHLEEAIKSKRLQFDLSEDEDETTIEVIHEPTDEVLGFIFAEEGEYVFESNLEEYFDDFVDEDADNFVKRLYETLRADLPKYEVEHGE
ncbi:MAG TPA: hypothetical protein VG983_04630 [Caulobacterales bacterium]|jgi:hypothetical protein|nr:hypothetical protein [Caulobacterales bacterium]